MRNEIRNICSYCQQSIRNIADRILSNGEVYHRELCFTRYMIGSLPEPEASRKETPLRPRIIQVLEENATVYTCR